MAEKKIILIRSVYSNFDTFSIQCLLNANYAGCGEEKEREKGFIEKKEDNRKEMKERQKRN